MVLDFEAFGFFKRLTNPLVWLPCVYHSSSFLLSQAGEQMTGSVTALQAEKERLMRSVSEKEAELSSLRQAAQVQQSSLQQERERNSKELGDLNGKLQEKVSQDRTEQLGIVNHSHIFHPPHF